uniref:Uncharacterized protein n=1 Tax=Chlamydomonas euryale TaxID=1486919 RepID=A0A7R9VK90_9CHLO|mmetsp:Transcript_37975/g.112421  ORF Transcript_37975/g.112421 Transcript_37975/m.112421 type:complete len:257 (+) Transcript_37975:888-1658(+)
MTEFVTPEGLRLDGRRPTELRTMAAQLDVLSSADGSAVFEMGHTKVMASVFGPREVVKRGERNDERAIIKCEYSMAVFSTGDRRRRGKGDRRSAEISLMIRSTLEQIVMTELLPRSQIDVYVQVLQADGGTRCAGINAALLALADAGIPLRGVVAACAAGYLDGEPLVDLNYEEDSGGGPDLSLAMHVGRLREESGEPDAEPKIVLMQMDSRVPADVFERVMRLAQMGCLGVAKVLRAAMHEHTERLATARGIATA